MKITERRLRSIIRQELTKNYNLNKSLNESMLGSIKDYFTGNKSFKTAEDVLIHAEVFSDVDSNIGDTFDPYEVELYNAKKAMPDKLLALKGAGLRVKGKVVKKILNIGNAQGFKPPTSLRIITVEDLAVDNMRHPSQLVKKQQNDKNYAKVNSNYALGVRIHYKVSIFAIMGQKNIVQFFLKPFEYELLGENKIVVGKGSIKGDATNNILMSAQLACPTEDLIKIDKEQAKRVDFLIHIENEDKFNKWRQSVSQSAAFAEQEYQDRARRKRERAKARGDEDLSWYDYIR